MKCRNIVFILIASLILTSCTRSPTPQYYVLKAMPYHATNSPHLSNVNIGLYPVKCPDYLDKSTLWVYYSKHDPMPYQNHLWAGSLKDNITRVIQTNLATLLPYKSIQTSPWNISFHPDYTVEILTDEFETNIQGMSTLRADYFIYNQDKIIQKRSVWLSKKINTVNPNSVVSSMNQNLTDLSVRIAHSVQGVETSK